MIFRIPRVRPGDEFTASHHNALVDGLRRCRLSESGGEGGELEVSTGAGGIVISHTRREWFWINLTTVSGGVFAWTEVIPQAGDTWVNGYRSGTTTNDPAAELNGNTTFTLPRRVLAWRDAPSHEVLFQFGSF